MVSTSRNPLLDVTRSKIACVLCSRSCKMWIIVAREVNFGMTVDYTISAEQRAIETVASMDMPHSDICLNAPYFFLVPLNC